jgi:3-phosphoshikimate 1-carboxyvinyltransferase
MSVRIGCEKLVSNVIVPLTPSKSISNRALIIQALCSDPFEIQNLSGSTDSTGLREVLQFKSRSIDVKDAGTAFRFLVSLLSIRKGQWQLSGSPRMHQRPIGPLVESLRSLGASIEFIGQEGFPPLKIEGRELIGGRISIDSSMSSQFISSLMLIAPVLKNGLEIKLVNDPSSFSYIELTKHLMTGFGANVVMKDRIIRISPTTYKGKNFKVENDWSSASYWYLLCALNPGSKYILQNLSLNSFQGDAVVAQLMIPFGVQSTQIGDHIEIASTEKLLGEFKHDFSSYPDLVMTFAVLSLAKKCKATFTGVANLRIKESDRLQVLKAELEKCGASVQIEKDTLRVETREFKNPVAIDVNGDHRFAMAFAPLATVLGSFQIDDVAVVSKSYPEFWEQMSKAGLIQLH